jgi:DNA-binding NarL/FixJ family response regulator
VACRVVIVDDDDLFAELLGAMLRSEPGIEVVGRARNGLQGVELCRRLRPDVATMDLEMPVLNGVEATRRITALPDPPRVVVVSSSLFDDAIAAARAAGANAYVAKSRAHAELGRLVLAVCRGEAFQVVLDS